MTKKFQIPKAKPDAEATMCEYLSLNDDGLPCDIDEPSGCALKLIGKVSKDGRIFTPKKPERYWCPRIEGTEIYCKDCAYNVHKFERKEE